MAAKGYCIADDVADLLGLTFTAAQTTQCNALIEQAEIYIDEETGRAWLTGAQTDEQHYCPSHNLFLLYAPVTSVATITGRTGIGESDAALTVDEDYEVRDATKGQIYLVSPGSYDRVQVDYTPVPTVPADLALACAEIVGNWLQAHLQPGSFGLDSYSLPDLTVKFSRGHSQAAVPPSAERILDHYRYRVQA
ncbi:MAG: hypothetical protein GY805_04990 [Chloroflexi bacterium]|nr:hypothetical protein [Chloroflexota bacterium]